MELVLDVLGELFLVLQLLRGHRQPHIQLLLIKSSPFFFFFLELSFFSDFDLSDFLVEVLLALAKGARDTFGARDLGDFVVFVMVRVQFLGLDAFLDSDGVTVKDLDLGHVVDYFESVVGFFCEGVAKEVQLEQEGKLLQEEDELVKVPEPVVAHQERV
eukprot:CAMPEP_0170554336 /NCGR_PEP_ID=MMETSP0211-20121228/12180_1 /TAXON_ID=311385 /ORGANISM="Pseudokeronopsis sp., Strain OXSARD2" /LENGTH=158 /DNA_ID=CAMNT_0010863297 /DNA_START=521 /DNA_END=997 /DNA_ORIENTATION=-